MAGIHRSRPGADQILPSRGEPAVDLGDGIWMSPGLSYSYLIPTDEGRVLLNTGMGFEGPLHRRAFSLVDESPIHTIILTQGHYDHVGGVESFASDGTEIIAHENFGSWQADNRRLEAFRARNAAFAWTDTVLAGMAYAESLKLGPFTQAVPDPTMSFSDRLELSIGGRQLVLLSTPGGETTDALVVWLPQSRTLFTGNLFGPLFGHVPNLVTIRGDRYRDALAYIQALDLVLDLRPERIITGHFDPIDGADLIAEEITTMRDTMQQVHDLTVDGMNAGKDVHTLMREVKTPDTLDVGEGYGKTSWNVRAIWETYAGWFHHRSTTELYDVPPSVVAEDLVSLAGADDLLEVAQKRLDAGQPLAALHLTDIVRVVEPGNARARETASAATRALLADASNFWERAWLKRSIDELGRP